MQTFLTVLVSLTLAEMMFAMGLRFSFSQLISSVTSNGWLTGRAFVANYLVIPGITAGMAVWFQLPPPAAIGLLILSIFPGAPYGPPFTLLARGDLALSIGLMVILAGSSVILAPLLQHLLLPLLPGTQVSMTISPGRLVGTLFIIQLLPLSAGLAVSQWWPKFSSVIVTPASQVSKVLNGLMIISIMVMQFRVFTGVGSRELAVMLALVGAGLGTGWLLGWPGKGNRITLSVITAMRNMSLSLGMAATAFPGSAVVTTVLVYSVVAGIGVLLAALIFRMAGK